LQQQLYLADPTSVLRARAAAMRDLELHEADTVALMPVTRAKLQEAKATPADLNDAVNLPMSAASIEMSVVLVEMEGGVVKCSFRSKGGVDVARLAAEFDGGGHARAAGARISGTIDDARLAILAAYRALRGA
jgi:phosphoesterase RecJ-like protein